MEAVHYAAVVGQKKKDDFPCNVEREMSVSENACTSDNHITLHRTHFVHTFVQSKLQ